MLCFFTTSLQSINGIRISDSEEQILFRPSGVVTDVGSKRSAVLGVEVDKVNRNNKLDVLEGNLRKRMASPIVKRSAASGTFIKGSNSPITFIKGPSTSSTSDKEFTVSDIDIKRPKFIKESAAAQITEFVSSVSHKLGSLESKSHSKGPSATIGLGGLGGGKYNFLNSFLPSKTKKKQVCIYYPQYQRIDIN